MRKILVLILLVLPFTLQAKYKFDETFFIPLEQTDAWKKMKESCDQEGYCMTRFVHGEGTESNWSELLTIQFKDRHLIEGATAEEAMANEQRLSPLAKWRLIRNYPNDVIYERSFPLGEHELVRMVMTEKGLHRAAYLKRGAFDETERRTWIECLTSGVVGH
ncbi:MAG: hypothetical protein JJU12_05480 [Chlamydiales bacterium]|nr:hypothetical protein [Chlamydiales bacterium]